jgi:hypothetical protein
LGEKYNSCLYNNSKEYKVIRLIPVFTANKKGFAALTSSRVAIFLVLFGRYDVIDSHAEDLGAVASTYVWNLYFSYYLWF